MPATVKIALCQLLGRRSFFGAYAHPVVALVFFHQNTQADVSDGQGYFSPLAFKSVDLIR